MNATLASGTPPQILRLQDRLHLLAALVPAALIAFAFYASAQTAVWNWAGGDRNWSTAANWSGAIPDSTTAVLFGATDAQPDTNTFNIMDASTTVASLDYTNSITDSYASFQNTTVAGGQTLTILNGLRVGVLNVTGYATDPYTYAMLSGAGGRVDVTGGSVQIGQQAATSGTLRYVHALLDMRGLDSFAYNNPSGTFSVAGGNQRRQGGEVFLAGANHIAASLIRLGSSQPGYGSNPGLVHLGVTNNLFANTIVVGRLVAGNLIDFQPGLTDPVAVVRAADGVSGVTDWYIGWNDRANQSASNTSGTNDFSGGTLDAIATNLYLGYFAAVTSGSGKYGRGALILGSSSQNSLVVENLYLGNIPFESPSDTFTAIGVLDSSGGTIKAGSVRMAEQLGIGSTTASLLLTNTTMDVTGDLADGGGSSTISLTAATLTVGGRIGAPTPTNIVETLNLNNAILGLTLVAPGDYTKATVSAGLVNIDGANGSTVLKINNLSPAPGQYPLIAYTALGGAIGFDGLSVQGPPGTTATLVNNTAVYPSTIDVVITADELVWDGAPNGNWDVQSTANWKRGTTSTTYKQGDRVLFNDLASGTTTVTLTTVLNPLGVTVDNTNKNYTFSGSGSLSGPGGLVKQGSGTLTLAQAGANDYEGTTYVGAGTLQVGNGGTGGNLGQGPVTVDGTIEFNRSDDVAVASKISGLGALTKQGANTVTLAGGADYAGPTTINGGTVVFSPSGSDLLAGRVSGSGRLAVDGPGMVVLTDTGNDYSGGTLVSSGTLQIGDGINQGSLPGNVVNDGLLVFNSSFFSFPGNISGTGGVTSEGSLSYFTLSGANTYTGPTTIRNGGTLLLGASSAMAPQSVLVLGDPSGNTVGAADFSGYNVVIGGLRAGGNSSSPANTITLGGGQSLTVNGNFEVGNTLGGSSRAHLLVNGPGASITVNTNGGLIQFGMSTSGGGGNANNLDCSFTVLDRFTANLGATGWMRVGEINTATSSSPTPNMVHLAATNYITAGAITIGNGGKSLTPELRLGSATNLLNADLIRLGAGNGRDSGKLIFETVAGSLRVRGSGGASTRANLDILVGGTSTGTPSENAMDLVGHYADLLLDSVIIGDQPSRSGAWTNYFGFDQGILDAASVSLSPACRSGTVGGTLMYLGGGTVTIGSLSMAGNNAAAMLDISGAQVTVNGNVEKLGTGEATLQVLNSTLAVNGRIGSADRPVNVITLDGVALSVGRSAGFGNPTAALVSGGTVSLSGNCTVALTGKNYVVGQFPLISYAGVLGGSGFAAITSFTPPPGVTATLVDNPGNNSIDVNILTAPPVEEQATLGFTLLGDSVGLSWQDLGMVLQTNGVNVASPTDWFAYPGSTSTTNVVIPVDPAAGNVFFRLLYP